MHGQDTLPLHGENLSTMNGTNRNIVKIAPPFLSSNNGVEKNNMMQKAQNDL
jgi:hypothetical protein